MGRRREGLGSWKYDISHWSGAGPMFKRWAIERKAAVPRNHVKRLARREGGMGRAEIRKVEMKAGAARVQCPGAVVEICSAHAKRSEQIVGWRLRGLPRRQNERGELFSRRTRRTRGKMRRTQTPLSASFCVFCGLNPCIFFPWYYIS